jgi:hypothetical protein
LQMPGARACAPSFEWALPARRLPYGISGSLKQVPALAASSLERPLAPGFAVGRGGGLQAVRPRPPAVGTWSGGKFPRLLPATATINAPEVCRAGSADGKPQGGACIHWSPWRLAWAGAVPPEVGRAALDRAQAWALPSPDAVSGKAAAAGQFWSESSTLWTRPMLAGPGTPGEWRPEGLTRHGALDGMIRRQTGSGLKSAYKPPARFRVPGLSAVFPGGPGPAPKIHLFGRRSLLLLEKAVSHLQSAQFSPD